MFRTPAKRAILMSSDSSPEEPAASTVAQARRSIESRLDSSGSMPNELARQKTKSGTVYKSRMTEATALLTKIKTAVNASRNIKTEIKNSILEASNNLWQLIKDAEAGKKYKKEEMKGTQTDTGNLEETNKHDTELKEVLEEQKTMLKETKEVLEKIKVDKDLKEKLEDHIKMCKETKEMMENIKEEICRQRDETAQTKTYANAVAGSPKAFIAEEATALHSIVVTSTDDQETGDEVVERIRKAMKAKEEGIRIDRIRKAKDRKVIIGVQDRKELDRVKENIQKNGMKLKYEDITNKDPLIIVKDVMSCHTNEELIGAIKCQNKNLFANVPEKELRMEVKYRRQARNSLLAHVVMRVSPKIWQQLTGAGAVFVDVQRVKVQDQSPLVQCSKCLGYGHGRRFCHAPLEVCSHCGGAHKKAECADWLAAERPICCNCQKATLTDVGHNAFSDACPVRKKWENLARSSIAYC